MTTNKEEAINKDLRGDMREKGDIEAPKETRPSKEA